MTIRDRIAADLTAAMKAGDRERTSVLRMLKARIQEAEVARRAERGLDYHLEDADATAVIAGYAKQRRDSIAAYRQAARSDLAAREEAELALVEEYLPRQLSEDEIREIVREAVLSVGASGARDIGSVMKRVMPKVKGAADGAVVNRIVREALGEGS